MIRRTALVSAAAATLVLAPTAAFAYDAPGFQGELTNQAPVAGTPFEFLIDGNPSIAGKTVVLTVTSNPASIPNGAIQIAGTASASKSADVVTGDVDFKVTLTQAGTYDAVATVDGAVIASQSVPVSAAAAASGSKAAAAASGSKAAAAKGGALADTGFDGAGLAAGAGALVVAGAGAVLIAKRRQSAAI